MIGHRTDCAYEAAEGKRRMFPGQVGSHDIIVVGPSSLSHGLAIIVKSTRKMLYRYPKQFSIPFMAHELGEVDLDASPPELLE